MSGPKTSSDDDANPTLNIGATSDYTDLVIIASLRITGAAFGYFSIQDMAPNFVCMTVQ